MRLLRLREDIADGDRLARSGFEDPSAHDPEGRVLLVGPLDQCRERRIVEDRPPVVAFERGVPDGRMFGLDPGRGHRRGRAPVVRADLEPVVDIFLEAGGPTAAPDH